MLDVMEWKFVVTQINMSDDTIEIAKGKDRKIEVLAQSGHLCVSLTYGANTKDKKVYGYLDLSAHWSK